MTKLALPPGMSLPQARDRLRGRGFALRAVLSDGASAATSNRAAVTLIGGAAHTLGAWTEIVASLSADVGFVRISHTADTNLSVADSSALLNIGVGAAASEQIKLDNLGVGWYRISSPPPHPGWLFPLFIPRGSRVAAQIQGAEASKSIAMRFEFFALPPGLRPSEKVVALGAVVASSRGTILATPGANNTEGAWTEITAATTEPFTALGISVQGAADTTTPAANILLDVAVGAAGAEVPVISDVYMASGASESVNSSGPLIYPVNVPAGTRLSARWQGSAVTGGVDVILHGVRSAA